MNSVFVKLVDRQSTVLWVGGYDYAHWNKPLLDYVDGEDKRRVESLFADVIIRGQVVEFVARWSCPMTELGSIWTLTRIMPVGNVQRIQAIAAVVVQQVLPDNFTEFNANDRQLLGMLAEDRSVREVADKLDRSESAIDMRIRALKGKLGVTTLHGLVAAGFNCNLVSKPSPPAITA
jgi:DNA-binding CsgD family transcriptional regulator